MVAVVFFLSQYSQYQVTGAAFSERRKPPPPPPVRHRSISERNSASDSDAISSTKDHDIFTQYYILA